ncbi:MAG: hypothetical protein AB3A66_23365 [Nodularia sp. CChRGM 3473]
MLSSSLFAHAGIENRVCSISIIASQGAKLSPSLEEVGFFAEFCNFYRRCHLA